MQYHLDLCNPETWQAFTDAGATCTGFAERRRRVATERVKPGDIFLCYMTRLSRWCGVLDVESGPFNDDTPRFGTTDPYPIRFNVKPIVILSAESAVPIHEPEVWQTLSITKRFQPGEQGWNALFRQPLNTLDDEDGRFLEEFLKRQQANPKAYPFSDADQRKLRQKQTIRTQTGEVEVIIPDPEDEEPSNDGEPTETDQLQHQLESTQYQAKVARVGIEMGFHVWLPRKDRARVMELIQPALHDKILDRLPQNFDPATNTTIENIDVLWLRNRSMARAFEIEHTTAVYSGLLRMADLLALQPNMDIRLHIVAPASRWDKFSREVQRPVFSLLARGPLYKQCSFLSYDSIDALEQAPYLSHMSDTVVDEHEEYAEV